MGEEERREVEKFNSNDVDDEDVIPLISGDSIGDEMRSISIRHL